MLSLCEPFEILLAPLVLTVATRVPEVLEMDDFTDVCAKVKRNKHAYHTSYPRLRRKPGVSKQMCRNRQTGTIRGS